MNLWIGNRVGYDAGRTSIGCFQGQIQLDDEWVRIHRRGILGHMGRGMSGLLSRGIQIRLSDIEDIEISYPRLTQRGWIRFLKGGEGPIGVVEAARDESAILFSRRQQQAFDDFREQPKGMVGRQANQGLVQAIAEGVAAGRGVTVPEVLSRSAATPGKSHSGPGR